MEENINESITSTPESNPVVKKSKKPLLALAFVLLAGLFAYFVWPTPYSMEYWKLGGLGTLEVRHNRITGVQEVQDENGWHEIELTEGGQLDIPAGVTLRVTQ